MGDGYREAYALTLAKTTSIEVLEMALKFAEAMRQERIAAKQEQTLAERGE